MSKVDTRVRRVTKPGANLFAELDFAPEEARLYQEQSRALMSQALALKEQLTSRGAPSCDEEGSCGPLA
ncbi:hypothetical protein [Trinickia sp. EG282A]|uniref:hypothetical protein n=1 Tax=Trinickia sp. EG282A TaxID=3237013 RepID=UPI0034D2B2B1